MIINIQPYQVTRTSTKLEILIPNFQLGATEMDVTAYILNDHGAVIHATTVHVPPEIYTTWGTDDMVIVRYVMSQLNIVAA